MIVRSLTAATIVRRMRVVDHIVIERVSQIHRFGSHCFETRFRGRIRVVYPLESGMDERSLRERGAQEFTP